MRVHTFFKVIRLGLAAAMIASLPALDTGPAKPDSRIPYAPPPKAAMAVIEHPVRYALVENWLHMYVHSFGLAVPVITKANAAPDIVPDAGPPAAPIPIVPAEQAYREDGIKRAFLTFDDGPTPEITGPILDILDAYGIKATFFVVGRMAAANPQMLKETVSRGHTIGNHSYTHQYGTIYSGVDTFSKDMRRADTLLHAELGTEYVLRLYRFPGGIEGWRRPMGRFVDACGDMGYCHVEWNALNGDAEHGGRRSAEELTDRLIRSVTGKEDVIVLMHDSPGKATTVEALPQAIEYLMDQGYQFCLLR